MADSAIVAVVSCSLSVVVTTITAAVWIKGQFGELGERLAKAETLHKSLHDRVEKLEDAREHDIRSQLGRAGII
jgi:hypothetical protein